MQVSEPMSPYGRIPSLENVREPRPRLPSRVIVLPRTRCIPAAEDFSCSLVDAGQRKSSTNAISSRPRLKTPRTGGRIDISSKPSQFTLAAKALLASTLLEIADAGRVGAQEAADATLGAGGFLLPASVTWAGLGAVLGSMTATVLQKTRSSGWEAKRSLSRRHLCKDPPSTDQASMWLQVFQESVPAITLSIAVVTIVLCFHDKLNALESKLNSLHAEVVSGFDKLEGKHEDYDQNIF